MKVKSLNHDQGHMVFFLRVALQKSMEWEAVLLQVHALVKHMNWKKESAEMSSAWLAKRAHPSLLLVPCRRLLAGDTAWRRAVVSVHLEVRANSLTKGPDNGRLEAQTPGAFQSHKLPSYHGASSKQK